MSKEIQSTEEQNETEEEFQEDYGEWWEQKHEDISDDGRFLSSSDGYKWVSAKWKDERNCLMTYGEGYYITKKEEIEYDEEGREMEKTRYSADGHYEKWTKWRYLPNFVMEFDDNGFEVRDKDGERWAYGDWNDDAKFWVRGRPKEELEEWEIEWLAQTEEEDRDEKKRAQ